MATRKTLVTVGAVLALMVLSGDLWAQRPGRGGRPSFEVLLKAFDANGDGELEETEVPGRVWARLGQADADGDGYVTRDEFQAYRPGGTN